MIGSQWWLPSDIVWKLGTQFRLWRLRLWSNYDWLLLLQVRAKNCRWVPPSLPHMSCCPRLSVLFYKPAHGCPSARSWMAPVLLHVLLRCHSARSWIVPRRHLSARSWIVACGNTREHQQSGGCIYMQYMQYMHLCIFLHILAYSFCIFVHIRCISGAYQVHILCILFAYLCIFVAYLLHICCISIAYLLHIFA